MNESILTSIKKLLGIPEDYTDSATIELLRNAMTDRGF